MGPNVASESWVKTAALGLLRYGAMSCKYRFRFDWQREPFKCDRIAVFVEIETKLLLHADGAQR